MVDRARVELASHACKTCGFPVFPTARKFWWRRKDSNLHSLICVRLIYSQLSSPALSTSKILISDRLLNRITSSASIAFWETAYHWIRAEKIADCGKQPSLTPIVTSSKVLS